MKLGQQVCIYPHPTAPQHVPMLGHITQVNGDGTFDVLAMPGSTAMKAYNLPAAKSLQNVRAALGPVGTRLEKYRGCWVIYPMVEGPLIVRDSPELRASLEADQGGDVMVLDMPATAEGTSTGAYPKMKAAYDRDAKREHLQSLKAACGEQSGAEAKPKSGRSTKR